MCVIVLTFEPLITMEVSRLSFCWQLDLNIWVVLIESSYSHVISVKVYLFLLYERSSSGDNFSEDFIFKILIPFTVIAPSDSTFFFSFFFFNYMCLHLDSIIKDNFYSLVKGWIDTPDHTGTIDTVYYRYNFSFNIRIVIGLR